MKGSTLYLKAIVCRGSALFGIPTRVEVAALSNLLHTSEVEVAVFRHALNSLVL